jgi:hypothetical protein
MPDGNWIAIVVIRDNEFTAAWWRYALRRITIRRRERRLVSCHRW